MHGIFVDLPEVGLAYVAEDGGLWAPKEAVFDRAPRLLLAPFEGKVEGMLFPAHAAAVYFYQGKPYRVAPEKLVVESGVGYLVLQKV